ncbi:UDP-N-acetylmuramate dehydrogenase [Candidatus Saccharibacteria bacterium]|nr:UDP-N-acetylmuramate dehydrogenase [Candidatus Saccharibacteria bacterium]
MKIKENVLISTLTTMRLGGPARYVIEVESPEEVPAAYDFARDHHLPTFILGGGANTIGHDEGFDGVIIINRMLGIRQAPLSTIIEVMGGEIWDDVVQYTTDRNLTGIEALSKIPGLASAAPVQNIGAYGQEVADALTEIYTYDTKTTSFYTLSRSDLQFSYRKSILNTTEKNRYFVISITLALKQGQMSRPFYNSIERYIEANSLTDFSPQGIREIVSTIRANKLPDPKDKASSGSFFKNIYLNETEAASAEAKGYPVHHGKDGHKINSGWLIEQAGLAGQLLHGMRVSSAAALVLINESATSYDDLAKARDEIRNTVHAKFGYWLEQEPVEIINIHKESSITSPGV